MPQRRLPRHTVLIAATAAVFLCVERATPLGQGAESLERVIARVKPAVVLILKETVLGGRARGTGFIYDPSGLILTNHHVAEGAAKLTVVLQDGRRLPATVVDYRRVHHPRDSVNVDAAVLRVSADSLPVLQIKSDGVTPIEQGQEVLVLGYPGDLPTEEVSVSRGIVSAIRTGWIQTDAVIVPGNSGGPAIDRQGRVIGLASFITGFNLRIGGIVSINNIGTLAAQARIPDFPRVRRVDIAGRISVIANSGANGSQFVKVWRRRFQPDTPGEAPLNIVEERVETRVQDVNGLQMFSVTRNPGQASAFGPPTDHFYVDGTGLYLLRGVPPVAGPWTPEGFSGTWRRVPQEPLLLVQLPAGEGAVWDVRDEWRWERMLANLASLPPLTVTGQAGIETVAEDVTVPAGTFTRCMKVSQVLRLSNSRSQTYGLTESTWYCDRGPMRIVRDVLGRGPRTGRWTEEVERMYWR